MLSWLGSRCGGASVRRGLDRGGDRRVQRAAYCALVAALKSFANAPFVPSALM
jgi:hypothetical protein